MNICEIEKFLKEGKVWDVLKIVKKDAEGKDDGFAKTFFTEESVKILSRYNDKIL